MTQGSYFVEYNRVLTKDVREMRLLGDTSEIGRASCRERV